MALPPSGHSYGAPLVRDGTSVKQSLGEWAVYSPNKMCEPSRDFKALNRMAIDNGAGLTPRQQKEFRKEHDARLKGADRGGRDVSVFRELTSYGKRNKPGTPMNSLVQHQFLQEYELECAKRGERGPSKKKKLPIVHTRASLGQRYVEPVADDKPTFKLKRFENVKGKGLYHNAALHILQGSVSAR